MSQILIFGDSITYGACDIKEGGWTTRLRKYCEQRAEKEADYYYLVYNLGVSGQNSNDILQRFAAEAQQRIKEEGETIILFAIGTNDSQLDNGKFKTESLQFKDNLQKLTDLAKKYTNKIAFIGLFPVDETKTCPIIWNENKFYKNENLARNNQLINDFCRQNDLIFIDIYNNYINTDYQNLLEDGLHPNTDGHQQMFEIIKDELIKNKII